MYTLCNFYLFYFYSTNYLYWLRFVNLNKDHDDDDDEQIFHYHKHNINITSLYSHYDAQCSVQKFNSTKYT